MDDEDGRKPSRVAFNFLVWGYVLLLIGFALSVLFFVSAFATGERISTEYEIFTFSALYFGFGAVMGSQVWYFSLHVKSKLSDENKIPRVTVFREPVSQGITLLVFIGYVPLLFTLSRETYQEGLIFVALSRTSWAFLLATPFYIVVFYFAVVRPKSEKRSLDEPRISTEFNEEAEEATVHIKRPGAVDVLKICVDDEVREKINNPNQGDSVTVTKRRDETLEIKKKGSRYRTTRKTD